MTTNAERDVSANTQTLIDLLRKRDALGLAKYGVSLDRTDLSATDWIQHAVEELLDGAAYLTGLKRTLATPAATSDVLPQEPAGRELPDGPGFWQRYGEKWVIRQHTESMFFGCHCDANGYLGRTIAVLPKGGWRRADAGEGAAICGGCGLPGMHKKCPAHGTDAYMVVEEDAWGNAEKLAYMQQLRAEKAEASLATAQAELAELRGVWVAGPPTTAIQQDQAIITVRPGVPIEILCIGQGAVIVAHWSTPIPAYTPPAESEVGRG